CVGVFLLCVPPPVARIPRSLRSGAHRILLEVSLSHNRRLPTIQTAARSTSRWRSFPLSTTNPRRGGAGAPAEREGRDCPSCCARRAVWELGPLGLMPVICAECGGTGRVTA